MMCSKLLVPCNCVLVSQLVARQSFMLCGGCLTLHILRVFCGWMLPMPQLASSSKKNIHPLFFLCPNFSHQIDSRLFIGNEYIPSQKGTIQGILWSCQCMHALGVVPLICNWLLSEYPGSGMLMIPLGVVPSVGFVNGRTNWFVWASSFVSGKGYLSWV